MSVLRKRLEARQRLLERIRAFFTERGVLEVTTPVLGSAVDTEPRIEPFHTCFEGAGGNRVLYLQTSPEFHMKRLLAAGSGDIWQLARAFRQGEYGPRHNPEFSLLEWYRIGFDHHRLMGEVAELVNHCLETELPVEKIAYRELFLQRFGWDPLEVGMEQLAASARNLNLDAPLLEERDQWLDLFMGMVLEPELGRGRLTFVHGYPASKASLARLDPVDPRTACRFELYLEGVELANGFHELTDAGEQAARFEADNRKRRAGGQAELPVDRKLIAALEQGLPESAGVALGVDRLLMLKTGASSLEEVLSFPFPEA